MSYLSRSKEPNIPVSAAEPRLSASPAPAKTQTDIVSTIGPGMLITGSIMSTGAVQVSGRVNGEIRAAQLIIDDGGKVEGTVTVEEAVVRGIFKGKIHGNSVKLQGAAKVEGEIYNKSLTIEQNVLFDGVSRRLDRSAEPRTIKEVKGVVQAQQPARADYAPIELSTDQIASPATGIDFEVLR